MRFIPFSNKLNKLNKSVLFWRIKGVAYLRRSVNQFVCERNINDNTGPSLGRLKLFAARAINWIHVT